MSSVEDGMKIRVVQYARVSTDDKGQTTETQKVAMDNYCKVRGYEVIDYISEEMSASSLNRPGLKKALTYFMFGDADILLAYDQSRITRGGNLDEIIVKISPAKLMFVTTGDLSADSYAGEMMNAVQAVSDKHENKVRRSKTRMTIRNKKLNGEYQGRPAKFMFEEDLKDAPKGRYREKHLKKDGTEVPATRIITEDEFYGWAKKGYSLGYVATTLLNVPRSVLLAEIKLREEVPEKRLRKYARAIPIQKLTEEDYIYVYRFKGKKDRYTPYMEFYEQAIASRKS